MHGEQNIKIYYFLHKSPPQDLQNEIGCRKVTRMILGATENVCWSNSSVFD